PNYLRARRAIGKQRWSDAIFLLEKVRVDLGAQTDWSSRVYALLAVCHENTGDTEQRLAALQRAVQIEPGWTAVKHQLGMALLAAGRLDDAAAELEAVSKAADAPPTVWTTLAEVQLLLTLRRPESACAWSRV